MVEAIRRADGTDGEALADEMEQFENVDTVSGNVNFSPELHTVFGREYRVIEVENNKGKYFGAVTAQKVPDIG